MTVVELTEKDVKKLTRKMRELANLMQELGVIKVSNSTLTIPKLKIVKANKKAKQEDQAKAQEVLDYYRVIHPTRGKGVKPGHRMFKLIQARLDEGYSVSDLKLAIDGNKIEKWHRERAAGHGLDFIFRNSSKVEQFIEETKKPSKGEADGRTGYNPGSTEFTGDTTGFGN